MHLLVEVYPVYEQPLLLFRGSCRHGKVVFDDQYERRRLVFTLVAAVAFPTSPLLWVETRRGPEWSEERRLRIRKQNEKAKAETENILETDKN